MASSVLSGSMAPRPSDTWSARMSPNEGSVTVPTIVSLRARWPVPTITLSPMCLPSWRRVLAPSSIWPGPASGWPLVVGGLDRAEFALQAEDGDFLPVDRDLGESELRPAR